MRRLLLFFCFLFIEWICDALPTIHIIGDSHSFFSFSPVPLVPGHGGYPHQFLYNFYRDDEHIAVPFHIHWIGPRTMHRVGRDGLEFLNLKKFRIKKNDYVVFVFGEIDIRCHVLKHRDTQKICLEEIISRLVYAYINTIVINRDLYGIRGIIFGVVPPTNSVFNPEFPTYGSLEERIVATKMLNAHLEKLCKDYNLFFLNVYDDCATEWGDFNPALSDGNVHIATLHNEFIKQKLLHLIANEPNGFR